MLSGKTINYMKLLSQNCFLYSGRNETPPLSQLQLNIIGLECFWQTSEASSVVVLVLKKAFFNASA